MSQVIVDLVNWLKQWFYTESEVDDLLGEKVSVAQGSDNASKNVVTDSGGNVTLEAKPVVDTTLSSTSENAVQNKAINSALSNKADNSTVSALSNTVDTKLNISDYVVDTTLSSSSTNPLQNKAINTALNNKAPKSHASTATTYGVGSTTNYGHVKVDDALSSSSGNPVQNQVINTALGNKADKTGGVSQITDGSAHTNIGTNENATQQAINTAIDTAIGNLQGIKALEVVTTLPTADASTMNKLYIVSEDNKVNVYYTEQNESSYSWHKMDADILDELSISWSDVTGKPFTDVDSALSSSSTNPVQNQAINTALSGKAPNDHSSTSTTYGVATTQKYGHVKVDDSLSSSSTNPLQNQAINTALSNKEDTSNKVTSISSSSTDTQYPTAKCVYDSILENLQLDTALILTINGTSLNSYDGNPITYTGDVYIDYGDGTITKYNGGWLGHTYSSSGTYIVKFYGNITALNGAFANQKSITSVTIGTPIKSIGNYCFRDCTKLTSIDLGTITSIGIYVFYGCTNLSSLTIPSSVTSIGFYCFKDATSLNTLYLNWDVSDDIIAYNKSSAWLSDSGISHFIIPKGTKSLYTAKSYPSAQLHSVAYEDESLGVTVTLGNVGETNAGCIIFNTIS